MRPPSLVDISRLVCMHALLDEHLIKKDAGCGQAKEHAIGVVEYSNTCDNVAGGGNSSDDCDEEGLDGIEPDLDSCEIYDVTWGKTQATELESHENVNLDSTGPCSSNGASNTATVPAPVKAIYFGDQLSTRSNEPTRLSERSSDAVDTPALIAEFGIDTEFKQPQASDTFTVTKQAEICDNNNTESGQLEGPSGLHTSEKTDTFVKTQNFYLTRLLETGCFTAVSQGILDIIVKQCPECLNSRLLNALVPPYAKDLNLKACTNVGLLALVDVSKKCDHIQRLNLTGAHMLIHADLFTFFGLYNVKLTTLILEENACVTDEVVHSILTNLPLLTTLNVSCTKISTRAFLVDEYTQLAREVALFPQDQNGGIKCSLTNVDISGIRELDTTAVRHLVSLTGPSLKHVNISWSSIDCCALLYLAGFSMPAIISSILFDEAIRSDPQLMACILKYRDLYNAFQSHFNVDVATNDTVKDDSKDGNTVANISVSASHSGISAMEGDEVIDTQETELVDVLEDHVESFDTVIEDAISKIPVNNDSCNVKTGGLVSKKSVCDIEYDLEDNSDTGLENAITKVALENDSSVDAENDCFVEAESDLCVEAGNLVCDICEIEDEVEEHIDSVVQDAISKIKVCDTCLGADSEVNSVEGVSSESNQDTNATVCEISDVDVTVGDAEEHVIDARCLELQSAEGIEQSTQETRHLDLQNTVDVEQSIEDAGDIPVVNVLALGNEAELPTANVLDNLVSSGESSNSSSGLNSPSQTGVYLEGIMSDSVPADASSQPVDNPAIYTYKKFEFEFSEKLFQSQIVSLNVTGISFCSRMPQLGQMCLEKFAKENEHIERLSVSWKGLTLDYFMRLVGLLPELTEVDLEECTMIQSSGVAALARQCTQLQKANLRGVVFINNVALMPFLTHKKLSHLDLAECDHITDKILILISKELANTLTFLDLSWCEEITEKGINAICQKCSLLKGLRMKKCPVSDTSVQLLVDTATGLQNLSIESTDNVDDVIFTDAGVLTIAQNLALIKILDIGWNLALTDTGVCAVFKNCVLLEEANLSGLKQITVQPFLPIISDLEDTDQQQSRNVLPRRSTVYAPNLRVLDLDYCDLVSDHQLQRIVNVCRGTLRVSDYYGIKLQPE